MTAPAKTAWIGKITSSPIGAIWLGVSAHGLAAITIYPDEEIFTKQLYKLGFTIIINDQSRLIPTAQQISEYLSGKRKVFDLPLDWSGMLPFQVQALKATLAIPYGQTKTYADIARQIGKPKSARAVGRAEATNPIPLVIPCHRVIGSDGKLHGYGGGKGLETKAWLINLERSR